MAEIMAKNFLLLMKTLKDTQETPSIRNLKKTTPRHINFISLKSLLEIAPLSFDIKYYCGEIGSLNPSLWFPLNPPKKIPACL